MTELRVEAAAVSSSRPVLCPFNTRPYAAGLSNIGDVEMDPAGRFPVLRRPIAGTAFWDGAGPWPYLWIEDASDIEALCQDFRHLVTVTVVTQPGYLPRGLLSRGRGIDAVFFKEHFVYDPDLPAQSLSQRARARLRRCEAVGSFEIVRSLPERMAMAPLYEALKRRRGLLGGFFDKGPAHFRAIAGLSESIFFRVTRASGIGAMACGVIFGGMLQILHMAASEDGLGWDASYLLMHGLQTFAREQRLWLLTGGLPAGAAEGLRIFKARWANRFEPVHLLRIVNQPSVYAGLCAGRPPSGYFPAYRAP